MLDCALAIMAVAMPAGERDRPRAREAGVIIGVLPTCPLNAITDVGGVRVGHATVVRGEDVRTGVTAALPHGGNLFRDKVAGAVFVGNGFGKLMGSTQVDELGEIETPILLTSTLNVPRVADALLDYMFALPGNEEVRSINPLVAETNDGALNDIRGRHCGREEVYAAIRGRAPGRSKKGPWAPEPGPSASDTRGGLAPRRDSPAAPSSVFSRRPTSGETSPSRACRWAACCAGEAADGRTDRSSW